MKKSLRKFAFWIGFSAVLAYAISVHPPQFARGYEEDFCIYDETRQLLAENLRQDQSGPVFSEAFMAPKGGSAVYMPWSLERDRIGAAFWDWDRDFPFLWFYWAASLVFSYLVVSWILGKMGIRAPATYGLAAFFVIFNIPRHFKAWHHIEHLTLHWFLISIFLDAWIWQRFVRDKRWSWSLEFWRALTQLGVMASSGMFWGPALMEWILIRAFIFGKWILDREKKSIRVEKDLSKVWVPAILCAVVAGLEWRWFLPLARGAWALGDVSQSLGWHAKLREVFRPLWVDSLLLGLNHPTRFFEKSETVVSIGWIYIVPLSISLFSIRKRKGGPGFSVILPLCVLFLLGSFYIRPWGFPYQHWIHVYIPFMKYFRVASRWGLLLPPIAAAILALSWSEFSRAFRSKVFVGIYTLLFVLEGAWLFYPVLAMPPLSRETIQFLDRVKSEKGTTVLDLPFCMAGGNGVCSGEFCPNYPQSTAPLCFRQWHDKKVYGAYQSRLVESQCATYRQKPYQAWFDAWKKQRCFSPAEWDEFCRYLDHHSELSAVMVYPDIWLGASEPECAAQFDAHLGKPVDQTSFQSFGSDPRSFKSSRVLRYRPHCVK